LTPEAAAKVLEKLARELQNRSPIVDTLERAYRGDFDLKFASEDFRKYFDTRYAGFSDNWTQVVADAPHERLEIIGLRHGDGTESDGELWNTWLRNEADYFSDLSMLDAIVAKRAYALVWGDKDDKATITWEHPGQAIVAYNPETRARRFGAKVWVEDEFEYATLYTPDEVWKFQRPRSRPDETLEVVLPTSYEGGWIQREVPDEAWPISNPLGVVPLVELPNKPRLIGEPLSDIEGTLSMQHAINLLWAELFVAADAVGLPGRVITGAQRPTIPVLDSDGNEIGRKPVDLKELRERRVLWLEDPAAKIAEWSAADLANLTDVIARSVGHIAAQTRTPAHYFMTDGSFANVSADAMKALETGLVMRTKEKTQHFGRAIREVFRLVALIEAPEKADSVALGKVLWADIENRGDAQLVDALQKRKAIGYPMRYILELDGLPDPEIDRVMDMVDAEDTDPVVSQLLSKVTPDAQVGA
jgi:hypothetical protein